MIFVKVLRIPKYLKLSWLFGHGASGLGSFGRINCNILQTTFNSATSSSRLAHESSMQSSGMVFFLAAAAAWKSKASKTFNFLNSNLNQNKFTESRNPIFWSSYFAFKAAEVLE